MNVNPRIRQHGDDHAAPPARGVIPFSEMVKLSKLPPLRRRDSPERMRREVAATAVADPELDVPIYGFTDRPYLVAHPEREIAEADWFGYARCDACALTLAYSDRLEDAIIAAHRHNAERHPRRWARSQNVSGLVALDEVRRVTRWGADA